MSSLDDGIVLAVASVLESEGMRTLTNPDSYRLVARDLRRSVGDSRSTLNARVAAAVRNAMKDADR